MNAVVPRAAVAGIFCALSLTVSGPGLAADGAVSCQPLDPLRARIVEKADQGIGTLRRYVASTQGVHRLDLMEVVTSLEGWYAQDRCAKAAAAQPVALPPVAARTNP